MLPLLLALGVAGASSTEMVEMRDGVHLATEVWLPEGDGPWPVLLFRTPYGRAGLDGQAFADIGIAVVSQDMRGRFDSEGVDMIFTTDGDGDLQDGVDTMAWLADQAWCDGQVVTYGGSAGAIVQYVQAAADPPGLAGALALAGTGNLYTDVFFQGGAWRESLVEGWLEGQGSLHFVDSVEEHPYTDAFWDPVQTTAKAGAVGAPGVHIGGWYDIFQQGTLDVWQAWQHEGGEGAAGRQWLVMGPWTHGGFSAVEQGELVYPDLSLSSPVDQWEMVNLGLAGWLGWGGYGPDALDLVPQVQYYVMGDVDDEDAPGNEWRSADDWPPEAAPARLYLQADGGLAERCPASGAEPSGWVYDPEDPTPTVCGANLLLDAGPCDQAEIEARADQAVFSTGVLDLPLEVTGRVRAHLFVDVDQPDTDVVVRLTDVYPDGRSMLVTDGVLRLATRGRTDGITPLAPGEVVEAVVDLWSTSIVVNAGHELRVAVTGSNWPRFAANPNTGLDFAQLRESEPVVASVRLHRSAEYPSYVELPDPSRELDDYLDCAPPAGDDALGRDESEVGLCGCAAAPAPAAWALVAGALGLARRRRPARVSTLRG